MLRYLLMIVVCASFCASAQTSQIATLLHDGEVSTFYSGTALSEAYEAAVDGDVITLSAGAFSAPYQIRKSITIRGAGMGLTNVGGYTQPTTILDPITFVRSDRDETTNITLEGLYFMKEVRVENPGRINIQKCFFNDNFIPGKEDLTVTAFHSVIRGSFGSPINANNCVIIATGWILGASFSQVNLTNCYVTTAEAKEAEVTFLRTKMTNCVIDLSDNGKLIKENTQVNYSIVKGGSVVDVDASNKTLGKAVGMLKEGTFYELTDDLKEFRGNDGTMTGIYGGQFPFDQTLSYPRITKFEVSPKTSLDGKLSVEIVISGAE